MKEKHLHKKEEKTKGLIERSFVEGDEYFYRDNEMMRVEMESDVKCKKSDKKCSDKKIID